MTELPKPLSDLIEERGGVIGELSASARISESPPGLCLSLSGSLDNDNSRDFRAIAQTALECVGDGEALILDLAGLGYVSSAGVGALTTLLAEAKRLETYLFLRGMKERVKAVFELLGFADFFSYI